MLRFLNLRSFTWLLLLFTVCSCEKRAETENFTIDLGIEYAGLQIGKQRVYRVDSILFKIGATGLEKDTFSYHFEDFVVDTFRTIDAVLQYRIQRRMIPLNHSSDISEMVFTEYLDNRALHRRQNNLTLLTMVFPPRRNARWDGLALFPQDDIIVTILNEPLRQFKDWGDFRITETNGIQMFNDTTWSDLITVLQVDAENAIERRYSMEQYAKDEGLVYKEQIILDTQNISSMPWEQKAERGFILRMYRM